MMKTEVVSITHSNEGIRICWPDGESTVFANPSWLAEAYAQVMRSRLHARELLEGGFTDALQDFVASINNADEHDEKQQIIANRMRALLSECIDTLG